MSDKPTGHVAVNTSPSAPLVVPSTDNSTSTRRRNGSTSIWRWTIPPLTTNSPQPERSSDHCAVLSALQTRERAGETDRHSSVMLAVPPNAPTPHWPPGKDQPYSHLLHRGNRRLPALPDLLRHAGRRLRTHQRRYSRNRDQYTGNCRHVGVPLPRVGMNTPRGQTRHNDPTTKRRRSGGGDTPRFEFMIQCMSPLAPRRQRSTVSTYLKAQEAGFAPRGRRYTHWVYGRQRSPLVGSAPAAPRGRTEISAYSCGS